MFDKKQQVGLDTETHLIEDGLLVPLLVCMTLAASELPSSLAPLGNLLADADVAHVVDGGKVWKALLSRRAAAEAFVALIKDPDVNLVIHNAAYDIPVMVRAVFDELGIDLFNPPEGVPSVFDLHDPSHPSATIKCTMLREQLIRIAEDRLIPKRPSLAELVKFYYEVDLGALKKGPDVWRLRYAELDGVPVSQWPDVAIDYAIEDAAWHLQVGVAQSAAKNIDGHVLVDDLGRVTDETQQTAAGFALQLAAIWGIRTDPERSRKFKADAMAKVEEGIKCGLAGGFLRVNPKTKTGYSENRKKMCALIEVAYTKMGLETPKTDKGNIQYSTEVLAESGDDVLVGYSEAGSARKVISSFADPLEKGFDHALTSSPNTLVSTGRTGWARPPLQQPPRAGDYRACFVARPGTVYVTADWSAAEMCALGHIEQKWYGTSTLADAINDGIDVHYKLAAELLGCTYDEVLVHPEGKNARQLAKIGNFGFAGGMVAKTFVGYCKGYGVTITLEKAEELRDAWLRAWPENARYLKDISRRCSVTGDFTAVQLGSGRIRGGVQYTNGANTFFQGLVGDMAKAALWMVTVECWSVPSSPLYGSRVWLMLHDEILLESPEGKASDAAKRLQTIMESVGRMYHPDVKSTAEAALMRRWYKKAKPVFDDNGDLIPWSPTQEK